MDDGRKPMYLSMIGMPLTLLSFLLYVFFPTFIFIITFIIGLAMFIYGYSRLHSLSKRAAQAYVDKYEEMERIGFIISLDGPYVPPESDCTIEVLE